MTRLASLSWLQRAGDLTKGRRLGHIEQRGDIVLDADVLLQPGESRTVGMGLDPDRLLLLWVSTNARSELARGAGGVSEVQTFSTFGSPTSGYVLLGSSLSTADPIYWNYTASQFKTAIEVSAEIGPGGVLSASGGPWPSNPVTVTYDPSLGNVTNWPVSVEFLSPGGATTTINQEGSAGSLADQQTLEPTWPLLWYQGSPDPCPFTGTASQLTFTNRSSSRQTLIRFRALLQR
jgi:hypothetical protein